MLAAFAIEKIEQLRPKAIYVGLSGGVDSVVLLYLAMRAFGNERVTAVHINHRLQAEAGRWQAHCESICSALDVQLVVRRVNVEKAGSVETRAREARYAAFESIVEADDALLLAHHRDDQVETIIHNLLRGSSTPGLMGMPVKRELGGGWLIRPLIECSRAEIEAFAREARLSWVEDPSNQDQTHTRNAIRHRVLPLLEETWPDLRETLLASMKRDAEIRRRAASVAEQDLVHLRRGAGLALSRLASLPHERQFAVIRCWLERLGLPQPSQAALAEGLRSLVVAPGDRAPQLSWQGVVLRRYRGEVFLGREHDGSMPDGPVSVRRGTTGFGGGLLTMVPAGDASGLSQQFVYVARPRHEGMMMQRRHARSIKKVMQEAGIPPWLRHRLPVICVGDEVAALPGLPDWGVPAVISEKFAPKRGEIGLQPDFRVRDEPYSD